MDDHFLRSLCEMSSLAYQTQYIVHGNLDRYALPDELFDIAYEEIERVLLHKVDYPNLSQETFDRLAAIFKQLDELADSIPLNDVDCTTEELILRNVAWAEARNLAKAALGVVGYDVAACDSLLEVATLDCSAESVTAPKLP